jgi:hypothetical protein
MPLLDHFHPPLSDERRWEGLHGRWAHALADALNRVLPEEYFAEAQVTVGAQLEIDVATMQTAGDSGNGRTTATLTATVAPPDLVMPAAFSDAFEVLVTSTTSGPTVVAAIELASPRNKDRPAARAVFASKCAGYLGQGLGLILVDVVTNRTANLHDLTVEHLGQDESFFFPAGTRLYAVAYHPVRVGEEEQIEMWRWPLTIGEALPTAPLFLRGEGALLVDLEAGYMEARERIRLT